MKRIGFLALLCAVLLIGITGQAAPTWVSLGDREGTNPVINLLNNTSDSIVFTLTIPGFYKENTDYEDTTYQKIWFPDETALSDSGVPQLPTVTRLIAIPGCDSVIVSVTTLHEQYLSNYLVYPAPYEPPGMEDPEFAKNDSLYATNAYYPGSTKECSPMTYFRDQNAVSLIIKPVWFSPDSEKIVVYDSLKVTLTFIDAVGAVNEDAGIFTSAAQSMFLNYDLPQINGPPGQPIWVWCTPENIASYYCDYLIITAGFVYENPDCKTKIQELALHRATYNGFYVCLVNVEDITNWTTWSNVRDFIIYLYELETSQISSDGRLPFVLLVGDAWDDDGGGGGDEYDPLIPRTEVDNPLYCPAFAYGSDHFYAEMDPLAASPQFEDLALGRIAIGDYDELTNMVDKIVDYETLPAPSGHEDWKSSIMLQAGNEINSNFQMAQLCQVVESCPFFDYKTYYQYWYETSTVAADESWQYNQGTGFSYYIMDNWTVPIFNGTYDAQIPPDPQGALAFFYMGHGLVNTELAFNYLVPDLDFPNVEGVYDDIDNEGCPPLIFTSSCGQGDFDAQTWWQWPWWPGSDYYHYDCFAEQYTHEDPLGAIAVIAAKDTSLTSCFLLEKAYAERQFGIISMPGSSNWHELIGWSFMGAKNAFGSLLARQQYMLFGDPALNLLVEPTNWQITENTTWSGRVDVVQTTYVYPNVVLSIDPGTTVVFHNGAKLVVYGQLVALSSPTLVTTFMGGTSLGGGIYLSSLTSLATQIRYNKFERLYEGIQMISTPNLVQNIQGNVFEDCAYGIFAYNTSNEIIDNEFVNCRQTAIRLLNCDCEIRDNLIQLADFADGIWAENCDHASFVSNTIENAAGEIGDIGFHLHGSAGTEMEGNRISGAQYSQLDLYHSAPIMTDNWLENGDGRGMRLFDDSQPVMNLDGAGNNRIADNDLAEIYIEGYKYPFMRNGHNDIADADDPENPNTMDEHLIAADFDPGTLPQGGYTRSVRDNWWYADGAALLDTNDVHVHIYPDNLTRYGIWVEHVNQASNTGYTTYDATLEDLFLAAVALEKAGDHQGAYDAFADILADNPADAICVACGYRLFGCALALNMDMGEMEMFFTGLSVNPSYADFHQPFADLASYCEVENAEFEDAISYYESVINDPSTALNDSVYAVIDAGAAYLRWQLMGGQINSIGSNSQLCPSDHQQYEIKVKQLLNLLAGNEESPALTHTVPEDYGLYQNYPNPFNPATTIRYDLPFESIVKLEVFDLMGRKVIALVDGKQTAGFRAIHWNGRNAYGAELASAVYFYRLTADATQTYMGKKEHFERSHKMVLIK